MRWLWAALCVRAALCLGAPARPRSLGLRLRTFWRLLREYPALRKVFAQHEADGFFVYGVPSPSFADLHAHVAFRELLALRRSRWGDRVASSTLEFVADFPVLPTYLPIEEGAAACLGLLGLAAADLHELRGGPAQTVRVRQSDAGLSTAGYMFLDVDPVPGEYEGCYGFEATIEQEGKVNPVRKAYPCRDGSHVFVHGGFPKLKAGILRFFGAEPTVESLGAAAMLWDGAALEAAMQAEGLAATRCRTPAEWRSSEQGQIVAQLPVIALEPVDSASPLGPRLLKRGVRPLSDVIVVDFSHVIASPMVGRTLADMGATVFKIVTEKRPRRALFDEETNCGKLTLELDLDAAQDRARLWDLLAVADVLVDGYSEGVLHKLLNVTEAELLARRPHLVYVRVSCYGHVGPMSARKGFQQNANFATGVGTVEDEALLGYQLTSQTDYATGFLGAAGAILALTERQLAAERGLQRAVKVHVSLCQAATWMARFGARMPTRGDYIRRISRLLFRVSGRMRRDANLRYLPLAVEMTRTPPARVTAFHRWWYDGFVPKL